MTYPSHRRALAAGLICAAAVSPCALAGKATIASGEGDTADFEYADGKLRIGNSPDSYMIVRDNTMYVVSLEGGKAMVFDASSMMKGMAQNATQMAPDGLSSDFVSLKDTGRDETVAGLKGDVYSLTIRDENGKEQTEEMVLSSDAKAREFRDALFAMSTVAKDIAGEDAMEKGADLRKRMEDMDVGVLRYGNEMKVTSISGETIPAERFELPAKPMDMQGLGSMLGSMSQPAPSPGSAAASEAASEQDAAAGSADEEEGGLFSKMMGAFGGKAERQTERAEDSVEDEVDERTDNAVDNALDKAFGKLFGDGG